MNLELLEEIHILKEKEYSDTDIASSLGISKSNLLLCIRMEKIISNKFQSVINKNKILNENILSCNKILQQKDEIIKSLKSVDFDKLKNEIDSLNNEIDFLNNERKENNLENYELTIKYENIPNFIKIFFER